MGGIENNYGAFIKMSNMLCAERQYIGPLITKWNQSNDL